jgi:hypothetical protein
MTMAVTVEPDAMSVGSKMQDLQFVVRLAGRKPAGNSRSMIVDYDITSTKEEVWE